MDKKNMLIGGAMLAAAIGLMVYSARMAPPPPAPTPAVESAPASTATTAPSTATPAAAPAGTPAADGTAAPSTVSATSNAMFASLLKETPSGQVLTLGNEFIEVRLQTLGGAIQNVVFKKYPAHLNHPEPYVFNQLHVDPMLSFVDFPGLDRTTPFTLVSSSATEVVFRAVIDNRIEVTRRYAIHAADAKLSETQDPYQVTHETTFRNLSDQTIPLPRAGLSLGTVELVNPNDYGQHLNVGYYDGDKFHHIERTALQGGGFLSNFGIGNATDKPFIEEVAAAQWVSVKNQFFAAILTPKEPLVGIVARRVELPPFPDSKLPHIGMAGAARVDLKNLGPQATSTFSADLYVGPKEYKRLSKLTNKQSKVMQFDQYFFNRIFLSGYVSPFLLTLLEGAHSLVPNWGIAIILMTLFLKVITLPFTLAASRASKRMQKLQPLLQGVREKYKDNPQKLNQATLEIFKEHKVNPMGGCLPVLITIPLFVGFFAMLQSAADLRFAPFLWAADLSAPDTIGHIFGLPINIMPLLMGATMIVQMRLTPTPTTDNVQAKMMQFMPILFTLFCYNFSCALALYSTINGLFTIGQQLAVNKFSKDDPVPTSPAALAGQTAKTLKNVTPKKK